MNSPTPLITCSQAVLRYAAVRENILNTSQ